MRIGFIGAGKHAQCVHLPNYANHGEVTIAGVADLDHALAKRVASRYEATGYASHRELIEREKPDALVVTLRPIPAAEAVLGDVLRSGIPSIVEKPLAWSVAIGERLVDLQKQTGTPMVVGYHKRNDPATMVAKQTIDQWLATGEMGKLRYARMHVSFAGDWMAGAYRSAIASAPPSQAKTTPIGTADGLSEKANDKFDWTKGTHSHNFDLMRHLIGPYHATSIDPSGVLMTLRAEVGIPAIFEFSPYESTKDWREHAIVTFDHGYVRVDLPAPLATNRAGTVEIFRDKDGDNTATTTMPVIAFKSAMDTQAANFVKFVKTGDKGPLCTVEEALGALRLARDFAVAITA